MKSKIDTDPRNRRLVPLDAMWSEAHSVLKWRKMEILAFLHSSSKVHDLSFDSEFMVSLILTIRRRVHVTVAKSHANISFNNSVT